VGNRFIRDGGGKGLAIGQTIAQIRREMPLEKRRARAFGRPHAPLATLSTKFPHVALDVFDNFVTIDAHDCTPPAL
jgi:hypothetical protein